MIKSALTRYAMPALASALLLGGYALPHTRAKAAEKAVQKTAPKTDQKTQPPGSGTSLAGMRYVAIGSSYAAGPMLPPPKPGGPVRCGQSFNNYPTLLAERMGMVLVDRSCSGATTEHVLGPWGDIPPQLSAVNAETRLVTVTIGGNDLSYIGNLFSAACAFEAKAVVATPGAKSRACGTIRVPTEADYVRDEAQMDEIARRIRAAAPQAKLVFVQYLRPLPRTGALCAVTPVTEAEAAITREIGERLAVITARVAKTHGAIAVGMDQASATHTPCDPVPWMIGWPANYDGREGLQWHLNKLGMHMTADAIASALIREGIRPAKPKPPFEPGTAKLVPPAPTASPTLAPAAPAPAEPQSSAPQPSPSPAPTPSATAPAAADRLNRR
ncbi:hypothetical protein WSK_0986 [Novosphingobium sp. Rr 2-17]|uniref:SGNH/GDSL hydrolase family protein n=1 Tax=Novosphingobium sp. Rr 2-17 TaxID=555793 RepID=UPI000269981D|nr:SGNH/GDSL hydrolase family protein [Novosphingobium sp. Rr 2-17]EIZ80428.1 hypothetical protein WSK_0986 [Novosphingobium sp. Rr 2-17]